MEHRLFAGVDGSMVQHVSINMKVLFDLSTVETHKDSDAFSADRLFIIIAPARCVCVCVTSPFVSCLGPASSTCNDTKLHRSAFLGKIGSPVKRSNSVDFPVLSCTPVTVVKQSRRQFIRQTSHWEANSSQMKIRPQIAMDRHSSQLYLSHLGIDPR